MKAARLIAGVSRQAQAAWTVLLSLLLAWSVVTTAPQAGAGPSVRGDAISILGTPELAALQVKSGPAQRAPDERFGADPDPFLSPPLTAPDFAADAGGDLTGQQTVSRLAHDHSPHAPRAPPAA